jgi:sucrose phosphorylase
VVKLFRALIDYLGLDMRILTETNVPHADNISYFGEGDEAHMVYNFALPPLMLHGAVSGDLEPLKKWARELPPPDPARIFLNFLASHDGVGLTPAKGLIGDEAFAATIAEAKRRGALVSYKTGPQGPIPYELNCSYASITAPPGMGSAELRSRLFTAVQAVLLSLPGLPAVYLHSWIGSENWLQGPELLGYNRAINREKPAIDRVESELADSGSFRSLVYRSFQKLIQFRKEEAAFGLDSALEVLDSPPSVFALRRGPDKQGHTVLCAMNFSNAVAELQTPERIRLAPYQTFWQSPRAKLTI